MTNTPPAGAPPPIDDDTLHAWVDGRLDAASRARVEEFLAREPEQAARVADWREASEALHAAFDPVAEEPVPARLTEAAVAAPPVRRSWWQRTAAAVALLALGGIGGYAGSELLREHAPPMAALDAAHLADNAALAHRVFSVEVRHPVEVGADQQAHLVQWLSRRLGTKLIAPHLEAHGYRLVGGRLLAAGEGPAAQLMYEDREGKRITAFVARLPVPPAGQGRDLLLGRQRHRLRAVGRSRARGAARGFTRGLQPAPALIAALRLFPTSR